jgi:hypothetical protein
MEFATGVFLEEVWVGAVIGAEVGFADARGFRWNSLSFAADMRSLTISVVGSGTLSSRASYLSDLDVLGSCKF